MKNSKMLFCFVVVIVAALSFLMGYNINQNTQFLNISASVIINVLVAAGITFYFTQRKHDERKQKEIVATIILRLQTYLDKECAYKIEDTNNTLMNNRAINNSIAALKACGEYKKYKSGLDYIENQFKHYKNLFGNHKHDLEYLKKSEPEFSRFTTNMSSKLEKILVQLYCNGRIESSNNDENEEE